MACSGKDGIDFFEPDGTGGDVTTGGSSGANANGGAVPVGGSAGSAGSEINGGSAGQAEGGTGASPEGGSSGDAGSTNVGATDAVGGMGGSLVTGGTGGEAVGGMGAMGGDGGVGALSGGSSVGGGGATSGGSDGAGTGGGGTGGDGTGGMAASGGAAGTGGCVPSPEVCDGIDNNCTGGIDEGNTCPANCTGATRGGHVYLFCSFENASNGRRNWLQASTFCAQRDLQLVFIESAEENAFLLDWVTRENLRDSVWIGANDRDALGPSNEGRWVWGTSNGAVHFWQGGANGTAIMNRYENWANGEPNNSGNEDCGVLASNHAYAWDDRSCSEEQPNFVCESL